MKRLVIIAFLIYSSAGWSQTRINHSQYMHNHILFNPAYHEPNYDLGGTVFARYQWMGFQGAPKTYIGNVFYNLRKHSINFQIMNDKIANFRHLELGLAYNYKVNLGENTTLSMGLKATYNIQSAVYAGLTFFDGGDPSLSGAYAANTFNFGAGAFARNEKWYAGFGAPYLFNNKLLSATSFVWSPLQQHFYATGGMRMIDRQDLTFYPTALVKFTRGAPLAVTIDMNALFRQTIWTSLGYRIDNTVVLSVGYIFLGDLKVVYSYDLGLNRVSLYGGMTHEISIGYGLSLFNNGFSRRKYLNNNGGFLKSYQRKGNKKEKDEKKQYQKLD